MARFHFKLARLLRVREIREEIARTELLAAESAVRAAEKTLEAWLTKRAEAGDAAAKERVAAWRAAGPTITGIPSVEQVEKRRAARAELAKTFVGK